MDELDNITYKAIDYCFKSMETLGYIVKEDLLKTVALTAITDIFSLFPEYITDKDYTDIMKALLCLSNSCFIDTPHFQSQESIFKDSTYYKQQLYRESENSLFRITEIKDFRTTEQQ